MISLTPDDGREAGNKLWVEDIWEENVEAIFTPELKDLLLKLTREFGPRRLNLLKDRQLRQMAFDEGRIPSYTKEHQKALNTNWKVAEIPHDLRCRRVEITGPVNDPKMVINMLSRNAEGFRADTAMLDFEDSMMPSWTNVLSGYQNFIAAVDGTLEFIKTGEKNKVYRLNPKDMPVIMARVRGLHMLDPNILVGGMPISAGLLDLVTCAFHTAKKLIGQRKTPKFYVPKCEHYQEARWWNDVFAALEENLGLSRGTLKVTFLIETLPAAFQIEEILFELKDRAVGLNVGRWDKIFSDIKVFRNHPGRVAEDRSDINMSRYWMDNYAKRLIKICHTHGAFAIGGMSAFTPGKTEAEIKDQVAKVETDKKYEFTIGHDGCWVSHPFFIKTALEAFPKENQIERTLEDFPKYPNLLMDGTGKRTIDGVRKNIRVGIAYLEGWLRGLGCVSFDNMMEDLATLEISRTQIWQWLKHKVELDNGQMLTRQMVREIFGQELEKINKEIGENLKEKPLAEVKKVKESFLKGAVAAEELFLKDEFIEFLTA
ncbi:MAG: malate synthase A [Deltaproteobacteria bacterium]|nr:MAG: malate synthase A [Deltaproteobacteria bacterium]